MSKRPKYRQPCECGVCPKIPPHRPATLGEWINYWAHDGWFTPEKVRELAIGSYLYSYARWVNTQGWRKPPGWTEGHVPLHQLLPKTKRLFPREVLRYQAKLMREVPDVG